MRAVLEEREEDLVVAEGKETAAVNAAATMDFERELKKKGGN